MVAHPSRTPATWADLDRVPDDQIGEIAAGELVVSPRPDPPHVDLTSDLAGVLMGLFRFGHGGPGGWVIRVEPRVAFAFNEIRVFDLAGWRRDRFLSPRTGPYLVVPDWVCEVLSPSTARTDRTEKMPLYAKHGVAHLWMMDPIAQTLEVYRLDRGAWVVVATFGGNTKVRAEPFDAVEIDLTLVWPRVVDER